MDTGFISGGGRGVVQHIKTVIHIKITSNLSRTVRALRNSKGFQNAETMCDQALTDGLGEENNDQKQSILHSNQHIHIIIHT